MGDQPGRHLTLAVPGLLGPSVPPHAGVREAVRALTEGLSLDALERFFARCSRAGAHPPEAGLTALLFACFGVARDGPDWPVAALTRRFDGGTVGDAWVVRADPVHLRVGMGELVLTDTGDLSLSAEEARALAAELNSELGETGLNLEPLAPGRWYVVLDHSPAIATSAPWDAVGSPVDAHLPAGAGSAHWRALMNDAQMILHASPVNRERERRGAPAVNSLWLWGAGRLPHAPGGRWEEVWSDAPLVAALAELDGATRHAPLDDARAWLSMAAPRGRHLVVLDGGYRPARCADIEAWQEFVTHLDRDWMAPMLLALRDGRLQSITIAGDESAACRLDRRGLRRWWRRRLPFERVIVTGRRTR